MSRSIRKDTSSFAFGMVGRLGGSSAGFVVAALNARLHFLKRKLGGQTKAGDMPALFQSQPYAPRHEGGSSYVDASVPARSGTKTMDCENSSRVNRRARVMALQ